MRLSFLSSEIEEQLNKKKKVTLDRTIPTDKYYFLLTIEYGTHRLETVVTSYGQIILNDNNLTSSMVDGNRFYLTFYDDNNVIYSELSRWLQDGSKKNMILELINPIGSIVSKVSLTNSSIVAINCNEDQPSVLDCVFLCDYYSFL